MNHHHNYDEQQARMVIHNILQEQSNIQGAQTPHFLDDEGIHYPVTEPFKVTVECHTKLRDKRIGALWIKDYQKEFLMLRQNVNMMINDVFGLRNGRDVYTKLRKRTLHNLDDANRRPPALENMRPHFHKVVEKGTYSFLQVDHIWEVQQLVAAIVWTDLKKDGTHVTFAQLMYLQTLLNDRNNLNVTTYQINIAKGGGQGALINAFLEWWWPGNLTAGTCEELSAKRLVEANKKRSILCTKLPDEQDTTILQAIGKCSVETLMKYWKPALIVIPRTRKEGKLASWTETELAYFQDLFNVMKHMCICLWPDELATYEQESQQSIIIT